MKMLKLIIAVACYALAARFTNTSLHADDNAPAAPPENKDTQAAKPSAATPPAETENTPPPAAAPTPGLLMTALGEAGIAAPLTKAGISIYGYVEGGYMYDFTAPSGNAGPTYMGFHDCPVKLWPTLVSIR